MWKEMLFTTALRQQKQLCGGSNPLGNDMSQLNRKHVLYQKEKKNRLDTKNETTSHLVNISANLKTHKLVATNHKASFNTPLSWQKNIHPQGKCHLSPQLYTAGAVISPWKQTWNPKQEHLWKNGETSTQNQQFVKPQNVI